MNLNEEQLAAVESAAPNTLVIANAGSGKTRCLAARIAHQIRSGIRPEQLVAITYTTKASAELAQRVAEMLGSKFNSGSDAASDCGHDPLREAIQCIHEASQLGYIGTIHGYALRILSQQGHRIGLPQRLAVMDETQDEEFLARVCSELHYKGTKKALEAANKERRELGCRVPQPLNPAQKVAFEYGARMIQSGCVSFDAILAFAIRSMESGLFQQPVAELLVDEYQDSTDLLHRFCMAHPGGKFFVGDDSQAIYGFNGGNVSHINALAVDPSFALFRLEKNYRSTIRICAAAQSLIEHNPGRLPKKLIPASIEQGEEVTVLSDLEDAAAEARAVSSLIHQYPGKSIAVLARTNLVASTAAEMLQTLGHRVRKRELLPVAPDWGVIRRFVSFVSNPENDYMARWFVAHTQGPASADDVELNAAISGQSINAYKLKLPLDLDPAQVPALLNKMRWSAEGIALCEKALAELAPGSGCQELSVALGNHELQWREIGAEDGVTVTTCHSAKGREFSVVCVIGCEDETFPGTATGAELQELRRLLFVGMTRARERLVLTSVRRRLMGDWQRQPQATKPSRFLGELGL